MSNKKNHTEQFDKIFKIVAPELHIFIEDHYETYIIMENVRNNSTVENCNIVLNRVGKEIKGHFQYEEQFILPKLNNYIAEKEVGPLAKLIEDHRFIEDKYNYIVEQLEKNKFTTEIIDEIKKLAYLVKKHIEKEDHYLFPLISIILKPEEKQEIKAKLEELKQ